MFHLRYERLSSQSSQLLTPKQIQGEIILWRRRFLVFVRFNAVLQSSHDLLKNHQVSIVIVIETF